MAKKKEFSKVNVGTPYCVWRKSGGAETGNTFAKPTAKRKYVKILAMCLAPMPASVIYPDVKHPMMQQVRDMCRAGLLDRMSKAGERRFYYKTTAKGIEVLGKVVATEQ